jgi:methylenetetrahydrofolate reductase (NADPH)
VTERLDLRSTGAVGVAALLARARFEVVPLSSAEDEAGHLSPSTTVTVTCSPRRGVDPTVDLAIRLAIRGFRAVPHLAARGIRSAGHLRDLAGRLVDGGIDEVFVIGGDQQEPVGPFVAAIDVLRALDDLGRPFARIGVAGYPERHPFIAPEELFRALGEKRSRASYVVTQICFDPAAVARWVNDIRDRGIGLPVYVGVPGAVTRRRLLEIALRIGVGDSLRYVTKHGGLVARLMRRGSYRPDAFLAGLSTYLGEPGHSVAGLHINTFNQVRTTERWRHRALATFGRASAGQGQAGA